MRLFLNLDTLRIHEGGIATAPVQALTLTRGDAVPVELTFFRGTTAETLPDGSTIQLAVKEEGDFSGSFLASLTSWTRSSDTYSGTLSCNTTEITTAVGTDTSISCALEIAWDVSGVQLSARPVKTTLLNDYIKGTEGVPTPVLPYSSFRLLSPDESIWQISITNDGQLVRTKL